MLKKFLTTIIVLAATATAWADGWKVGTEWSNGNEGSVDGQNTYTISVITWSESGDNATLADAITAANSEGSYMIRIIGDISSEDQSALSNIQKEKVDLSKVTGMTNFGVFAENTTVKYVILPDNTPKANVDALGKTVDAAASKQTRRWEYEYKGVKYAYLGEVSNGSPVHGDSESAIIKLPVQVGEPTFKVKESEESYEGDIIIADSKFYGVSAENLKTLNTASIGYIYNVDGVPFLYKGNVYMQNDQYVYYSDEEANRKELTMHENVYTYTVTEGETVTKHIYDDLTTVVDGKVYGYVGGTKYELSRENEWYYSSNGTETLYSEYIREENGKTYGVINYVSFIPVEYKEVYMNGNSLVTDPVRKDEKETKYYACPSWGAFPLTKDGDNYMQDGNLYEGNVYLDSKGQAYGIQSYATEYEVFCETRLVKKEDGSLYDGKVYHDNETPISYYGINSQWNTAEVELYNKYSYKNGEESIEYTGKIYADGDKLYGFVDGIEYELTQGTAYSYTDGENTVIVVDESRVSIDGKFYYTGAAEPISLTERVDVCYYEDDERNWVVFEGAKTPDNTKGYVGTEEGRTALIAVYPYTHPNDGESTYPSESPMTNVIVDYNTTITYTTKVGNSDTDIPEGKYHITAYVSKPGSLTYTLARWTELGDGNNHSGYGYKVTNVTALTLSGDVNYADIGTNGANKSISKYGHVQYYNSDTNTDVIPDGTVPESEKDNTTYYKDPDVQGHPNTIENNFAAMDGNALTYIDLTDAVFAVQTDMIFANVSEDFGTILLPTSPEMTLIPAKSFWGLNGEGLTEICIPYNYEEIGDEAFYNTSITHFYTTDAAGNTITNGPNTMTFSENLRIIKTSNYHVTFSGAGANTITDVYVMRYNPEDTEYPTTQCQPNAFQASMTCGNSGNAGDKAHPISRKNFQNQKMWMTILHYPQSTDGTEYEDMYTDLTRVYTLNDETGYVDGSGRPFKWPKHGEFVQASNSVKAENGKESSHFDGTPYDADFLAKHRGWIEFVLVGKSNNQDIDVQSEIEFVQRDWYTLCVPYDLTKSNLLELFGIDNPTETTDTELVTMLGETEAQEVEGPMYPDVRVITEVSRSLNNAKVTFHLSKPLLNNADGNDYGVVIPEEGPNQGQGYEYVTLDGDDPVIIEGGHPFLVRGFVPKAWDPDIKNMGMYVMAIAASVNSAATIAGVAEEELPYQMSDKCLVNGVSLPCVKHHIHARNADEEGEYVYEDKNKTIPACYHFIGTYTETTVPQYAYYLGKNKNTKKHQFFRTTKETTKWNPYSAVIIGLNDPGYNDGDFTTGTSLQNIVVKWNEPKSDLVILEGEDPARAGQALSLIFDEGVADDTTTGITDVDVNVNVSNNKVYSINGQYMGTSLNKLPKGIYIINGQKKVVK